MLKGLGNIGNLMSLMGKAGEITGKMGEVSEQLKNKRVTGSAGGGMVEVEANGLGQVLKVSIDPGLVEKQETEMIENLLPAAINDAVARSKQLHMESMQELTGGIPGLEDAMSQLTGGAGPDKPTG